MIHCSRERGVQWLVSAGFRGGLKFEKGLTVNPQFMAKRPLPTQSLVLRFSLKDHSEQSAGVRLIWLWVSWWITLRSEMSLWFQIPQVSFLADSFEGWVSCHGQLQGAGPDLGRPQPPFPCTSRPRSRPERRLHCAGTNMGVGSHFRQMRFLWAPGKQDPQIYHRGTGGIPHTSSN